MKQPSYVGFKSKEYHWKPDIDYRENPHLYKVGRGQQGVLICQPYKSEHIYIGDLKHQNKQNNLLKLFI